MKSKNLRSTFLNSGVTATQFPPMMMIYVYTYIWYGQLHRALVTHRCEKKGPTTLAATGTNCGAQVASSAFHGPLQPSLLPAAKEISPAKDDKDKQTSNQIDEICWTCLMLPNSRTLDC